jgi:diaminopimelate epimerase
MNFVKMQGTGNDYVFVNCFRETVDDPVSLARVLSDRHRGIGGDGLILLLPSDGADACMKIFNADGSEAEMCGNGARCAAKLLHDEGLVEGPEMSLETLSGLRRARLVIDGRGRVVGAHVEMGVPAVGENPDRIEAKGRILEGHRVSVGNPHFVVFIENVTSFPLGQIAPRIEIDPLFPERTNVEFAQVCNDGSLLMRVWERGVGETQACGTGAVAAVATAVAAGRLAPGEAHSVRLPGGELSVNWDGRSPAWLAGDAVEVFRGTW